MRKRYLSKSKSRRKSKRKVKSKRTRRSNKRDGMLIKKSGEYEPYNDEDKSTPGIFRKYFDTDKSGKITIRGKNELDVVTKLKGLYDKDKDNYNDNLIIIIDIDKDGKYYQTEVVDSYTKLYKEGKNISLIKDQLINLNKTRKFLLDNGIAYIDWKIDNTGLKDEKIKLFDFDASGTFVIKSGIWINKPELSKNYIYACNIFEIYTCSNNKPRTLDTFLFRNMIFNETNDPEPIL